MKIRYYLINKAQRAEYDAFKKVYERLGKTFYVKMLQYCKEKNGKVINLKYGEEFCERFQGMLDSAIKETENSYKFLIGITTDDGFYLSDMTALGIYNFTQLINFLRSEKNWVVEDDKGVKITIVNLMSLAKVKGIKPHYKETVNGRTADRIRKSIWYAKSALTDVQDAIEEEKYGTTRNENLLELEEKLINGLKILDTAQID